MLSVRLHISWESCLFRVVFHIMQAAWGKLEETELLHITAPLRARTVLAARRINLPSSPPAVWVVWRASAETVLTASAGNAPANECRNNSAGKISERLFLYFPFLSFFIQQYLTIWQSWKSNTLKHNFASQFLFGRLLKIISLFFWTQHFINQLFLILHEQKGFCRKVGGVIKKNKIK